MSQNALQDPREVIQSAWDAGVFGTWAKGDLRRAFVEGAKWWEYKSTGATMWQSDVRAAEAEAEMRYPKGSAEL